MKNLNLLNRLLSYSHEKQSPQRFGRYAVMLIMLLTIGVGQMWADGTPIYLDAKDTWDNTNAQFALYIQKSDNSWYWYPYFMTKVTGTDHVYRGEMDTSTKTVIFVRKSSGDIKVDDWNNVWNQTVNYGITNADKNYFEIGNQISGGDNNGKYNLTNVTTINNSGGTVYFDKGNWTSANKYLAVGYDSWTNLTSLITIDNTNLVYCTPGSFKGASYMAFIGTGSSTWISNNWGYSQCETATEHTGQKLWYGLTDQQSYLATSSGTSDLDVSHIGANYESLNHAQTAYKYVSTNNGSTYSEMAVDAGTITISAVKMKAIGTANNTSNSNTIDNAATTSASVDAAYTGAVTFSAEAKTGYTFVDWYDAASGGSTISSPYNAPNSTKNIYARFKANRYTVTIDDQGGSSGPGNQTVTYGVVPNDVTPPTKTGMGFDGYWTQAEGGIQVIDATGHWKAGVAYHTDSDKKWCHDGGQKIYAHWLTPGYYAVGEFNNWEVQGVMTATGVANEVAWESNDINKESEPYIRGGNTEHEMYRKSYFKIRQVAEGDGSTDTWWGLSTGNEFGKGITKTIKSGENDMKLQIYYSGKYTFKLNTSTKALTVVVPVINRLEIYNINGATTGTVDGHALPWLTDDWETGDAENTVTKTVQLERGKWYYFKPVYDSHYYGKTADPEIDIKYNGDTPPSTVTGLVDGQNNLKVTADLKGDYKFDFNYSDLSLTVTFPTRRQVNYSAVTLPAGTGNSDALTAENDDDSDHAISNGGYVVDGNSVTFTAADANAGYHFKGWFTKNNPSSWTDGRIATTQEFTISSITKDTTIYAIYSEDTLTVTVNATTGGSITTPSGGGSTIEAHPATPASIVAAKADEGWHFTGWTVTSGSASFDNDKALSTTVTTTENATIQANFVRRYALYGSRDNGSDPDTKSGLPGWSPNEPVDFTGTVTTLGTADGANLTYAATLEPNKKYKFQVYDRALSKYRGASADNAVLPAEANPSAGIYNNWELNAGTPKDVHINTVGYGTYTFHITKISNDDNRYPSIQVDRQSSKLLTLGRKVYYNDGASSEDATDSNGGRVTAQTNEGPGDGFPITSGQYYADGSDITFAAEAATGYEIVGWYSDASCSTPYEHDGSTIIISGDETESTLVLKNCTTAKTVYVKFEEIMQEVEIGYGSDYDGTLSVGGVTQPWGTKVKVGVHTSVTVTAVPNEHYYFAHWYRSEGQNYVLSGETEDYATVTITGSVETPAWYGVYSELLSPSFLQLEKVYFYNWNFNSKEPLWSGTDIYVGFNPNWNETESPEKNYYGADMYGKGDLIAQMERVDDYSASPRYNLWVADVPRKATKNSYTSIVFTNKELKASDEHISYCNATYRTDYNKDNNTFIPYHLSSGRYNFCDYYSDGYWKNYYNISTVGQGYYLEQYKGSAWTELGEFTASESGYSPLLQYEVRVDNVSSDIKFRIKSAGGVYYMATSKLTSSNYSDVELTSTSGSDGFLITPTVEGEYMFYIDQTDEKMKVNLNYPVAIGDYRLKHSYNIRNKADNADSTVYAYSDVIKARKTEETVSMYLNMDAATKNLVLQKCTDIATVGGKTKPVWSAGTAVSNFNTTTFDQNKGVYKFDITVNNTGRTTSQEVNSATPSEVSLYDGPYYIKTDTAKGRWAHYKENVLDKNTLTFDPADATTYDYYFVSWIPYSRDMEGSLGKKATNVKCVIANDYNNAVSDTLVGDAILGVNTGDGNKPWETLPYQSNVRFSYNSATNEVKRTYFQGASSATYLYLVPNEGGYVYDMTTPTPVDLYDSDPTDETYVSQAKFSDDENWVYELKVQAYPGAQAGVQAKYNGKIQTLLQKTNTLIGGEKDKTKYTMRLVYDFKTNFLMSAYTPAAGAITEALENIDVLIEREGQDAGTAITFSGSGALDAKKMIGAIKFTKTNYMSGSSSLVANWGDPGVRAKLKFLISFPFDVRMRDIFGLNGEYGRAYKIQRYDGAGRAKNGFFMGDGINSFWKDMTLADTIKANEGYAVICDNDYFGGTFGDIWKNNPSAVYLYFPSMEAVGDVEHSNEVTISVPAHQCTKDREFTYFPEEGGESFKVNHMYTDSHWNMMGVPTFTNYTGNKTTGTGDYDPGTLFVDTEINPEHAIAYFYAWSDETNKFTITAADGYAFKSMHGYMVQYTGDVTFKGTAIVPAAVAARRVVEQKKNYQIELQALNSNDEMINHTYVELRENACDTFALNEDVFMSPNSKAIEIFTFAGNYNVAANVLSVGDHTIPVGVTVNAAGTYTFSMPNNFSGTVTLIDTYTGVRTDLAQGDYELSLPQGTTLDRFQLEINISKVPTAIDGVEDGSGSLKDGKAHKFIMNGVMYILENGRLFDARGNRVK